MRFHVLTLFPDMVLHGLNTSIIGRAVENNLIEIEAVNIRDYSADKHGKVDDYPYGGGAGMLMQAQPVYDAWKAVADRIQSDPNTQDMQRNTKRRNASGKLRTVYVTPQGKMFTQQLAEELAKEEELVFLCGHYEGIDERVLEEVVTDFVSIGDYVLTGGELPAMVMIDAVARLVPGVLHNDTSAVRESFYNDLLEYPQYSRPEVWHDKAVPEVLLSGDHRRVEEWRLEQSKERTAKTRPDLFQKYERRQKLIRQLAKQKRNHIHMMESLARGKAQIGYWEGADVLLIDEQSKLCMITVATADSLGKLAEYLQGNEERILITVPEIAGQTLEEMTRLFSRKGNLQAGSCDAYCQFVYTQKVPLPIRHKDIRTLDLAAAEYVLGHLDGRSAYVDAEVLEQLAAGKLYGAYPEGKLVGIAGVHKAGDIGFLSVDEAYRRQGIASSLEAYCINRMLEEGMTPYVQVPTENLAVAAMQERLGLYRADSQFIHFS